MAAGVAAGVAASVAAGVTAGLAVLPRFGLDGVNVKVPGGGETCDAGLGDAAAGEAGAAVVTGEAAGLAPGETGLAGAAGVTAGVAMGVGSGAPDE